MTGQLSVARMGDDTVAALRELLSRPPEGWCWCVAWEVPTWAGWGERTAEQNRELRESLWARGQHHGYVFRRDGEPVGWCRVGPTSAWPKLVDTRGVPSSDELHAFTCFGLRPELRGQGLVHDYLRLVVDDLAARGVRELVAFPKPESAERAEPGEMWNGPLSAFLKAGFRVVRTAPTHVEVRMDVPSTAP